MPLYEFRCRHCGRTFSELLTMRRRNTTRLRCPGCKSRAAERLMSSSFALAFRGAGTYDTDHAPAAVERRRKERAAKPLPEVTDGK